MCIRDRYSTVETTLGGYTLSEASDPPEDGSDPCLGGTEGLTLTLCRLYGLSWLLLASEGPWLMVRLGAAQRALTSEGGPPSRQRREPRAEAELPSPPRMALTSEGREGW